MKTSTPKRQRGRLAMRQYIWTIIRTYPVGADWTINGLRGLFGGQDRPPVDTVRTYLRCLEHGGHVKSWAQSGERARFYTLFKDIGAEAPRLRLDGSEVPPTAQDLMWRTIFILGKFTIPELCFAASTEQCKVSDDAAKRYCKLLSEGAYLKRYRHRRVGYLALPRGRTGPYAPEVQAHGRRLYDPNLDLVVVDMEVAP